MNPEKLHSTELTKSLTVQHSLMKRNISLQNFHQYQISFYNDSFDNFKARLCNAAKLSEEALFKMTEIHRELVENICV